MYNKYKIKGIRKNWVSWLADFEKGESRPADIQDRSKIAISISNNFHKKGLAVFTTKKSSNNPDLLIVTREK